MGENDKMVMPVAPMYGGNYGGGNGLFGNGGDWLGILFLIALLNGGMWGGFGGAGMGAFGMANGMLGYDFPWLMTGQQNINSNTNNGFRDAMINDNITSVRDGISALSTQLCGCCGDMQMSLANGFAGVNQNVSNGFANTNLAMCQGFNGVNNSIFSAQNNIVQQLNTNEIASLNRSFAEQTANMQGFNGINAGIADLRYAEATEGCATRTASAQNTRDIIDAQTRGTQAILDKLCALELDGVKGQLAQAQRENVGLQNQLNMAALRESQTAQNAFISQGFANEVDQLYTRLSTCPIPSTPVYGRTPIFTCPNNPNNFNCGCGCNG